MPGACDMLRTVPWPATAGRCASHSGRSECDWPHLRSGLGPETDDRFHSQAGQADRKPLEIPEYIESYIGDDSLRPQALEAREDFLPGAVELA